MNEGTFARAQKPGIAWEMTEANFILKFFKYCSQYVFC